MKQRKMRRPRMGRMLRSRAKNAAPPYAPEAQATASRELQKVQEQAAKQEESPEIVFGPEPAFDADDGTSGRGKITGM